MLTLYDIESSGNCYKVRLLLSMLDLAHHTVAVDFRAGDNQKPDFLALNPFGLTPVLVDGERVVRDSQAILIYLARQPGGEAWLPTPAGAEAEVLQWLFHAAFDLAVGPAAARYCKIFGSPGLERAQENAHAFLALVEAHLAGHDWLALGRATLADVACYPHAVLAPQADIGLDDYPALRAWLARFEALPGYLPPPPLDA